MGDKTAVIWLTDPYDFSRNLAWRVDAQGLQRIREALRESIHACQDSPSMFWGSARTFWNSRLQELSPGLTPIVDARNSRGFRQAKKLLKDLSGKWYDSLGREVVVGTEFSHPYSGWLSVNVEIVGPRHPLTSTFRVDASFDSDRCNRIVLLGGGIDCRIEGNESGATRVKWVALSCNSLYSLLWVRTQNTPQQLETFECWES